MLSSVVRGSLVLACLSPSALFAQYGGFAPPTAPNAPDVQQALNARQQRSLREQAVAKVGPVGRDFVETYGQDAVAAIFACTQPAAQQLAEVHASGDLARLPRPRDLLRIISRPGHGSDVALWAIAHFAELTDLDNFDAYLVDPLSYAMALKNLEQGAAEVRDRRLGRTIVTNSWAWSPQDGYGLRMIALGSGVTVIIALLVWRVRQRPAC